MNLTEDEQKILDSVERGEWQSVPDVEREAERYRAAARATLQKDKRVTIRMSEHDLNRFRKAALRDGLPYQTLIASILHKYINGSLVENGNGS